MVPRCRLNTYDRRAFPVAGPTVWNSLPDKLRDPACDVDSFKQFFLNNLVQLLLVRLGYFQRYALYKSTFYLHAYLLTFLYLL